MKLITANKLKRFWSNGVVPKLLEKLDKTRVLTSTEQVQANTNAENVVGALIAKELINDLGGMHFYEDATGNKFVVGADSVPKKLGSGSIKRFVANAITSRYRGTYNFTYDLSNVYENYKNITKTDIIGGLYTTTFSTTDARIRGGTCAFGNITNYDPETGIITATVFFSGTADTDSSYSATPCFYICD